MVDGVVPDVQVDVEPVNVAGGVSGEVAATFRGRSSESRDCLLRLFGFQPITARVMSKNDPQNILSR